VARSWRSPWTCNLAGRNGNLNAPWWQPLRCFSMPRASNLNPQLWTNTDGLITQTRSVLEVLARVQINPAAGEPAGLIPGANLSPPANLPLVWLTHRADSIADLPNGSRWLLWQNDGLAAANPQHYPGLSIATISGSPDASFRALQTQLQSPLSHATAAI
jgi:hypothetical protein